MLSYLSYMYACFLQRVSRGCAQLGSNVSVGIVAEEPQLP